LGPAARRPRREIIKIEDPAAGGDAGRYVPPFQEGETPSSSRRPTEQSVSSTSDIPTPRVFEDIVRECDAVY
jgi:hypothetical protein